MEIGKILKKYEKENKEAIICGDKTITYREWNQASINLENTINKEIGRDSKNIGLFLPNSIEYAIAYFAIAFSKHVIVPIHIRSSNSEIEKEIRFCELDVIITSRDFFKQIIDLTYGYEYKIKIILVENNLVFTQGGNRYIEKTYVRKEKNISENVAIMLHTSGTTSNPKKVMLTHNNLITNVEANIKSLNLDSSFKTLIALPMCFGYCNTTQFLTSTYLGATMVIMEGIFSSQKFFKLVEKQRITHFTTVPTILYMLLKYKYHSNYDYSSLKIILYGGGAISARAIKQLNSKYSSIYFCQTYGQTECSPRVTLLDPVDSINKIKSVGRALPGVEIKIVDKNGHELKEMSIGEVCVYGKNVMKGYYKCEELTNKIIKNGWIKTGDLGYIDNDGYLYLVGRKKNIIISGGINIYPEEIEEVIGNIKGVEEVYVTGKTDELLGQVPYAYVVCNDEKLSKEDIYRYCCEKISNYKLPKDIYFVENLERTKTGKIRRTTNEQG